MSRPPSPLTRTGVLWLVFSAVAAAAILTAPPFNLIIGLWLLGASRRTHRL